MKEVRKGESFQCTSCIHFLFLNRVLVTFLRMSVYSPAAPTSVSVREALLTQVQKEVYTRIFVVALLIVGKKKKKRNAKQPKCL